MLSRTTLATLLLLMGASLGCGDDENEAEQAAIDSCTRVCEAVDAAGCPDRPLLEQCKQRCSLFPEPSSACYDASIAYDDCVTASEDVCIYNHYEHTYCEDELDARGYHCEI